MRVVFGDCELDSGRRVLLRYGRPIPLSPKAFQLLELLLDRRPEAIAKAELLDQLWRETFVSDASLHNLVAESARRSVTIHGRRATSEPFPDTATPFTAMRGLRRLTQPVLACRVRTSSLGAANGHLPRVRTWSAAIALARCASTRPRCHVATPASSFRVAKRHSRISRAKTEPR
jgi:Transcriptional regulatory protein, C terminal